MLTESPSSPTTVAIIDIGTNTVLLLVAKIDSSGLIHPLVYEQRIPRLGRNVDASRTLHPESIERVVHVLAEYRQLIAAYAPSAVAVIATSAVRDARNKEDFLQAVRARTGFLVEILPGDQEAYWTYRGALSGLPAIDRATVVDIGGGSTEITTGTSRTISSSTSLDIGSVRLTERMFRHDPPTQEELAALRAAIREHLDLVRPRPDVGSQCVAVAGTATTLALLVQGFHEFSLQAVSGMVLTQDQIGALADELSGLSVAEILRRGSFLDGRADVITAGAWILKGVMEEFGFDRVLVSERGVRYGIALREWEKR